jgi:hypothetical protein
LRTAAHIVFCMMTIDIEVRTPKPSTALLEALARSDSARRYTATRTLYYEVLVGTDASCGVFGDGANACYEWFIWTAGKLETSNVGYGDSAIALRDVLKLLTEMDYL